MNQNNALEKIGLGTVQFGLNYGISNQSGKTPKEEVYKILQCASDNNITSIDTAHTYGNSEDILGCCMINKRFNVVTKTIPTFKAKISDLNIKDVTDGIFESIRRLRIDMLDGLLVHHCNDLMVDGGDALYMRLN